jgi:cell division protein FtsB
MAKRNRKTASTLGEAHAPINVEARLKEQELLTLRKVNEHLEREIKELREDRRRLTQSVESLARRADRAECGGSYALAV